jgi:Cu(I)/Ag(I) efflux system membrane fusion protein
MPGCFDQRKALPVTGQAATSTQPAAPATQPPTTAPTVSISASQQQAVDELAIAYLNTHDLLVKDELEGVPDLLKNVHEAAGRLSSGASPALTAAAEGVAHASDSKPENLDEARVAYKQLSAAVIALVQLVPPTAGTAATLYQIHCPMTKGDWLQTSDAIANPYYGQRMLTCGEVVAKFNGTHAK